MEQIIQKDKELKLYEKRFLANLKIGEYETFEVVMNTESEQIKVKIFDERWRTVEETIEMLKECISVLANF